MKTTDSKRSVFFTIQSGVIQHYLSACCQVKVYIIERYEFMIEQDQNVLSFALFYVVLAYISTIFNALQMSCKYGSIAVRIYFEPPGSYHLFKILLLSGYSSLWCARGIEPKLLYQDYISSIVWLAASTLKLH